MNYINDSDNVRLILLQNGTKWTISIINLKFVQIFFENITRNIKSALSTQLFPGEMTCPDANGHDLRYAPTRPARPHDCTTARPQDSCPTPHAFLPSCLNAFLPFFAYFYPVDNSWNPCFQTPTPLPAASPCR